ncbi:MAG: AEC family transporter [Deltaproteobacteria bacterium]|nr:AEC family transporter [Deltaproteobacteria bacterium]
MELIIQVLYIVFPVFFVIAVGYGFAAFKKIELTPVLDLLLYITIPALVIASLAKQPIQVDDLIKISIAAFAVILVTGILAWLFLRVTGRKELRGFYMPTMFLNGGNLPFPLGLLAFGAAGLQAAVLYYIAVSIVVYTVGIYILKGGVGGLKEIFKLPLIYATVIGLSINLSGMNFEGPLLTGIDMIGVATIPLMQISLGYYLFSIKLRNIGITTAGVAIRMLGGFLVALLMVELLNIEGVTRKMVLLSSSMPSAVITFIMCYKYKLDSELVASIVAMSTFLSIITIPLLLYFIM